VIVVHGTWAAPRSGKVRWHQPCDTVAAAGHFTTRLDAELEKRGSPARCWAHCSDAHPPFHWSGDNSWIERTHAAVSLAEEIARLKNAGWLCHLVAHSHGGNVAVEALAQVTTHGGSAERGGNLVTLGTPFLDAMAPIVRRTGAQKRFLKAVYFALTAMAVIAEIVGSSIWYWEDKSPAIEKARQILAVLVPTAVLIAFAVFVIRPWLLRRAALRKRKAFEGPRIETASGFLDDYADMAMRNVKGAPARTPLQVSLLAIGSPMDEAWQVLHHLCSLENPLAIRRSLSGYLLGAMRSHMSQAAEIARIHGARSYGDLGKSARFMLGFLYFVCIIALFPTFFLFYDASARGIRAFEPLLGSYAFAVLMPPFAAVMLSQTFGPEFLSAFLAPFRWIARAIGALFGIPAFTTTYLVRRKSWSVLLAMAMGMEGYRFALPAVEQSPGSFPREFARYEDMPGGAEARAMDRRNAWIARHLDGVSQTFAKMVISPADMSLLLATIEQDQSLVHAAYYTDDECIARIADWIAGAG
jgi:hypothetical protein